MGSNTDSLRRDLATHGPFLRALARSLVFDEQRIDDIVQEAYLAALRQPPDGRGAGIRAWLAAVVRNAARQCVRTRERARRRDEATAKKEGSVRTPAETAERDELRRIVVDSVLALEPQYRDIVMQRFFEGLKPREIARHMGLPVETVRTRIRRALALLRVRLARHFDEGTTRWSLALMPLLTTPRTPRPAPLATIKLGGILAMKAKVATTAVLLVGALVATWTFWPRTGASRPRERSSREAGLSKAVTHADAQGEPPTIGDDSGTAPASNRGPAADRASVLLNGTFKVERPRLPGVATVTVRVLPGDRFLTVAVGADNSFALDVSTLLASENVRALDVSIDHPFYLPVDDQVGIVRGRDGVLPSLPIVELRGIPAGAVTGIVVDERNQPIAGAEAAVLPWGGARPVGKRIEMVRTNAAGRYRLRAGRTDRYLIVALAPSRRAAHAVYAIAVGNESEATPLRLVSGVRLPGRVRMAGRDDLGGAHVIATRSPRGELSWRGLTWENGAFVREHVLAEVAADGTFVVRGLSPGPYDVRLASVPGGHPDLQNRASPRREVVLPTNEETVLQVPHAVLRVAIEAGGKRVSKQEFTLMGASPQFLRAIFGGTTDDEGVAEVGVLPDSRYVLRIERAGYRPYAVGLESPGSGNTVAHVARLTAAADTGALAFRWLPPGGGVGPATVSYRLFRTGARGTSEIASATARTQDGTLRIDGLVPGRYRCELRAGHWRAGLETWLPDSLPFEVERGQVAERTRILRAGARLRIAVRAPDGRRLVAFCNVSDATGAAIDVVFSRRTGHGTVSVGGTVGPGRSVVDPALPPGNYRVKIHRPGFATVTRLVQLVGGKTETLDVELAAGADSK